MRDFFILVTDMNLKDEYNKKLVEQLANDLYQEYSLLNKNAFTSSIINEKWEQKELKERIRHVSEQLNNHLALPYSSQIDILIKIAPNYRGLQGLLFPDFVQIYGLENLNVSIKAMASFTKFSTAEFAIRPFIEKYPEKAIKQLMLWSKSDDHHLRRLASEGCRPKLPWAPPLRNFIKDPLPCLPVLETLKADESEYVRKSVANHLNDISKNHPNLVLKIAKQWYGSSSHTNWIVKHALRTLLKKGNKEALSIFGLNDSNKIVIENVSLTNNTVKIGDFIHFNFEVKNQSKKERNVRLEYKIDYVKANKSTSGKVFQISEFTLKPQSQKSFTRKQWFKQLTTRVHYPGNHKITLIINGDEKASTEVNLV